MQTQFTASFFRNNRQKLLSGVDVDGPVIVPANGLMQSGGDMTHKFYQDRNFWYLTGLDIPNAVLVMHGGEEYVIVPKRDPVIETFEGKINLNEVSADSGVKKVLIEKEGWKKLTENVAKSKKVATLSPAPSFIKRVGFYTNPSRARLKKKLKRINGRIEFIDIRPELARMRSVKQPEELKAIQSAIDITLDTLSEVHAKLPKYRYENEIEADITQGLRYRGATGHAFTPIVASGANTATLHHIENNSSLENARIILFDIGAEYNHYASDISRTYFLKEPTEREQRIYESVHEVVEYAKSLIKPGLSFKELERSTENFMGEKLLQLGIVKENKRKLVRKYFPNATAHSLGLDPHDAADYKKPIQQNMVLAVEPCVSIPEEGIGVRIEDNLLVTKDGSKDLSTRLPNLVEYKV